MFLHFIVFEIKKVFVIQHLDEYERSQNVNRATLCGYFEKCPDKFILKGE